MNDHLLLALPAPVVDELLKEADRRQLDPGELLVELLRSELPGALAEAARDHLTHARQTGTDLIGMLESDDLGPRLVSRHLSTPETASLPAGAESETRQTGKSLVVDPSVSRLAISDDAVIGNRDADTS